MVTVKFLGWGARIEDVEKVNRLVLDLDPDDGLDFKDAVSASFHVRDTLGQMGLTTFPIVTGGKGNHVIAPLTPSAEWPMVHDFAHRFALALVQAKPSVSLQRWRMPNVPAACSSITCATSAARQRFP
jgi:bifunctional non-homologous end joining protein LigD